MTRIGQEVGRHRPELQLRLAEDVTTEQLPRVARQELTAAAVLETPAAGRRYGVRIDALRDEPLLAALPETHSYAAPEPIATGSRWC